MNNNNNNNRGEKNLEVKKSNTGNRYCF